MSPDPRVARVRPPGTVGFGRDPFGSAPFGAPRIVVDLLSRFGFGRAPFGTSPFGTPQPPTGG